MKGHHLTSEQRDKLVELYKTTDAEADEIGGRFGVSGAYVRSLASQRGVRRTESARRSNKLTPEEKREFLHLYENGMRQEALAEKFNIALGYVTAIASRNNVRRKVIVPREKKTKGVSPTNGPLMMVRRAPQPPELPPLPPVVARGPTPEQALAKVILDGARKAEAARHDEAARIAERIRTMQHARAR